MDDGVIVMTRDERRALTAWVRSQLPVKDAGDFGSVVVAYDGVPVLVADDAAPAERVG